MRGCDRWQDRNKRTDGIMIIFLLTVCVCLLFFIVGLLLYIGYKVRQFEDTQDVIFDAAVNAEERNREIELNQEAILNAYSRQN